MVRIRLARMGRKRRPIYKVVAADARSPRDGRYIEKLGVYNPISKELNLNLAKVDHWIGEGAQATETAAKLIERARKSSEA